MIKTIEELKEQRPELVKAFNSMSESQIREHIWNEVLDLVNMQERVQTFMNELTPLSKTTYTTEVITQLIQEQKARDISDFCEMTLEDTEDMSLEETRQYLRDEVIDIKF